jgi:hypothetical protein
MPRYASISQDATAWLREKTGSSSLECFVHIDANESADSFFLIRYTERIVHVSFAELTFDPGSFKSLVEALYKAIYET